MNRRGWVVLIGVAVWLICGAPGVRAAATNDATLGVTEEDDSFSNPFAGHDHTDRYYTQGLRFTYISRNDQLPASAKWVDDRLPAWGISVDTTNLGGVFGQNIYTPENIATNPPSARDRPYGGWLYAGLFLQRRGVTNAPAYPQEEDFEIDLGITGRPSLAEGVQENWHRWFFSKDLPKGWHDQLATEPGLLLKYQRLLRFSFSDATARYVDVIPHAGGEAGNIGIFANAGGTMRVGTDLPDDFGVEIIDSPAPLDGRCTPQTAAFSCYVFGEVDGRYVAHNLFLDGNTFQGGPSVTRIPWVADMDVGGTVRVLKHFEISYVRVIRTPEFKGQDGDDIFASITAKAIFRF